MIGSKKAQQYVLLVDTRKSGKARRIAESFLHQEVLVRSVAVNDIGLRQSLRKELASGPVCFDDLDLDAGFDKLLCKEISDLSAADYHSVGNLLGSYAVLLEEIVDVLTGTHDTNAVTLLKHKITVRDNGFVTARNGADQNIAFMLALNVVYMQL